jgi:predicted DNA-binding antitoxin AbrB/MazE fold protein
MNTIIAIYEKGILRPLRKLDLAEHSRVMVQIIGNADDDNHPLLTLANLGESQESDVSARDEEILNKEIHRTGWSASNADPR